jgi:hypothetical protein
MHSSAVSNTICLLTLPKFTDYICFENPRIECDSCLSPVHLFWPSVVQYCFFFIKNGMLFFLHFWLCLQPSRVPIEIASFNHTHETTHVPLNRFSQNLFVRSIIKFDDIPVFIKSGQCTWRPTYGAAHIMSITNYQGKHMFEANVEKNETMILQVHFFHVP